MVASLKSPLKLLRAAAAGTLVGWAAQHLFWEVPYRSLLWSESFVRSLIPGLSAAAWSEYATSPRMDTVIQNGMHFIGMLLLTIGLAAIGMRRIRRGQTDCAQRWLIPATGILGFVSLLIFKEAGFRIGMLIEYTAQVMSPLLLYWALKGAPAGKLTRALTAVIALTFLGHGLFAVGYYPIPGNFIDMTINTLGVSEAGAVTFLQAAGVLDFVICVALFHPRTRRAGLFYAAAWGLLTTLARPVSSLLLLNSTDELPYWVFQSLLRMPHFLLPLALLRLSYARKNAPEPEIPGIEPAIQAG